MLLGTSYRRYLCDVWLYTNREEGTGPEAKYSRAYEAKVNPFADFQQSEADSRLRNLPAHERALLASSRIIMGSRIGRAVIAVYAVLLHVFIMVGVPETCCIVQDV